MSVPEYHAFDEYKNRLAKLEELQKWGIDPYPHKFVTSHRIADVIRQYTTEEGLGTYDDAVHKKTDHVMVAGRIVLSRPMGKNIFLHIQEEEFRLQLICNRDITKVVGLGENAEITDHKFIEKKLDLGDFIGVQGHLCRTQKGELTLLVTELTLLSKSLLPLPDKHSGLKDKEMRYRKRWLDLIANPDVMRTFKMRSRILQLIRKYFDTHEFLEVETPVLGRIYGGAEARPFRTELNALHINMFMRIALEISLKKLIAGGIERVFEMGKLFRNEGIDATHNPEFTMLECYASYWDYNDMMKFTESLYEFIAKELFGTTKIGVRLDRQGNEHTIDLKAPWKRMTLEEAISTYSDIQCDKLDDEQLRKLILERTEKTEGDIAGLSRNMLILKIFEEITEEQLIQPHFIYAYPIESIPLCKLHRDKEKAQKGIIERAEGFILGTEICNMYSELNDPILQRQLLEDQANKLAAGDEEAHPLDEEFIEAITQGMPPCSGNGIGIDRLVMLFTSAVSIRDVLFFPIMKDEAPTPEAPTSTTVSS